MRRDFTMKIQFCCLCLLGTLGCGLDRGTVSGTVTYEGVRVPDGTICFLIAGRVFFFFKQKTAYEIPSIPPGEAIVTVFRLDPKQPDPYDTLAKARQQMMEKKVSDVRDIDRDVVTD